MPIRPAKRHNSPTGDRSRILKEGPMTSTLFHPMTATRLPHVVILVFVVALAVSSCHAGPRPGGAETDRSLPGARAPGKGAVSGDSLAQLRALVAEVVGDSACTRDAECRTMAFGSKPCGGPWSYLVYSTATTDSARLGEFVQRYNAYEDSLNRAESRFSDCMLVQRPVLVCQRGLCTEKD